MKLRNDIYKIGASILAIVLLSFTLSIFFSEQTRRILSVMLVAVGLVSFYGFIGLGVSKRDLRISKSDIRLATIVSLITFYIVLVGTVSMFAADQNLPAITETMLTHFTTIIGVVIAFYFGTEVYLAAKNKSGQPDDNDKLDDDEKSPSGENQNQG
jgi:FlaA1/EpsC-like NDP-sugar epimerase